MRLFRRILVGALCAAGLLIALPAGAQLVTINVAPPAVRAEVRTTQPSPRHVWVGGYWKWENNTHVWTAGRWDVPAQAGMVWHAPSWSRRATGWVFEPGRWINAGATVTGPIGVAQVTGTGSVGGTVTVTQPNVTVGQAVGTVAVTPTGVGVVGVTGANVVVAPGVITVAPPPVRVEVQGPRRAGHVWIGGHWRWNGRRHVWTGGRWMRPARANAQWRAARWEQRNGGWVFVDGAWEAGPAVATGTVAVGAPTGTVAVTPTGVGVVGATGTVAVTPGGVAVVGAPAGTVVVGGTAAGTVTVDPNAVVMVAPPAPQVETQGPAPAAPGHVWVGGYWQWNGQRHVWVGGRWAAPDQPGNEWEGPQWRRRGRGWIFVPGHWRRGRRGPRGHGQGGVQINIGGGVHVGGGGHGHGRGR